MTVERAIYVAWWAMPRPVIEANRIYFGHETCEHLLPSPRAAAELVAWAESAGMAVTLVTPFLGDGGVKLALKIIERILASCSALEVVFGDWGLLHELRRYPQVQPVLGRLLAVQPVDPRLARIFSENEPATRRAEHLDGTPCTIVREPASPLLKAHLQSAWLCRPDVQRLLQTSFRVERAEVSFPAQGLRLEAIEGWAFSLHADEALLSVMRTCPHSVAQFRTGGPCTLGGCEERETIWHSDQFPAPVLRRGNALYVQTRVTEAAVRSLPVDRLVWRHRQH
ncbi:MAG: hypothetical protein IT368_09415 [Candidatus Hydrogenedentes bacterium]|nr:hypothetical protein [Candidatus Hydrogenedentota bacterium]